MSDFTYKRIERDSNGHIRYICDCSVCGKEVPYGKITYKKPMCYNCYYENMKIRQKELYVEYEQKKREKNYGEGFNDAISKVCMYLADIQLTESGRGNYCYNCISELLENIGNMRK